MADLPGIQKPALKALPRIRDRITFLYLERCAVNRQDGAITVTDARGCVHIPSAAIGALLLGPGTTITHRAMELIGDSGASVLWVGEHGVRYYAHGRPLTHSSALLIQQANLVSNARTRIAVARKMYQLRFPGEDVSAMSMQQLRGREGARVRSAYRRVSNDTGLPWHGREFDPDDFLAGDDINKALSAAHACLYGIAHCVIVALGLAPGLGFVHTGHERSFVYDIADLYKVEITIPIAFQTTAEKPEDIAAAVRHKVRDALAGGNILARAVKDIHWLLMGDEAASMPETNVLYLWDDRSEAVATGVSYADSWDDRQTGMLENGYGRLSEDS